LRDRLWSQLAQIEGIYLNGHPIERLAGNLNISVSGEMEMRSCWVYSQL
jgi:cysteine desulfurase